MIETSYLQVQDSFGNVNMMFFVFLMISLTFFDCLIIKPKDIKTNINGHENQGV